PQAPLAVVGEEDVDVFYESGVKGTLWGMQAVYPHMQKAGWGRIVNVASAAGITGMRGYGAYNASKEAIRALTRTAAREWGRDGIVVNCICPGAASKRGQEAAARDDEAYREFLRDHPIGRQGDPEDDIAPVVLFLCSDASRYLTGQTLMVDGDRRGQGIGSALMAAAIEWARTAGAHKLSLQVWPHNEAARALYRKFGFEEEGLLRRQYRRRNGELWDAIVMGLLLD